MEASENKPKLAIIGAGIAGLSAAWLLRDAFDVSLFEAQSRAGGHADTQTIRLAGENIAVDTGFIVFNNINYPNLVGFFAQLGVATHNSNMSFGVSINNASFEYAGGELHQLFAQPGNILKPRFWRMVRDILRFNKQAPALLTTAPNQSSSNQSLGAYLAAQNYSVGFIEDYILPMGAAIWSASVDGIRNFPAQNFIRFFVNHGLLKVAGRPQWKTVTGGSRQYVEKTLAALGPKIHLGTAIKSVTRTDNAVLVDNTPFDKIIFACHADQALALLTTPTIAETRILDAVKFQDNEAVLHQDINLMPRRKRAWSSWNYLSQGERDHGQAICLTYWMNLLQGMKTDFPLLVSLNPNIPIDPAKILLRKNYRHPQFTIAAMDAQQQLPDIQGQDRIFYAGAWTGYGFHEDGIASSVKIANALGVFAPWQTK